MVKLSTLRQTILSISIVILLSVICHFMQDYIDYRVVALILLLAVSILAALFDILPVLLSAFLSAVILNFFFIEPTLNYKINNSENALLFLIYIVVALVNAVLTNRLRKQEAKVRDKEEKENTIKLYNTLLNSLSHELKTPISTIIGGVDILKDKRNYLSSEQRDDLLMEMEVAGSRLNNQVENLLNMSRLETGTLRLKMDWCDLNEVIFMVLGKIKGSGGHRIVFEPDERIPLFKIDQGLIEIALYGLVHNAVRYTPVGSEIQIHTLIEEEVLHLAISDNGSGIPDLEKNKVFDKFYRLPASGTGGTGLGLSIARGVVEAHGGRLILSDSASGGATFVIEIPAEVSYLKNLKNE